MPVRRAELLAQAVDVTLVLADTAHLSPPRGVMLMSVGIGGAATMAGRHKGDVILDFNGSPRQMVSPSSRSVAALNGAVGRRLAGSRTAALEKWNTCRSRCQSTGCF